MADATCKTCPFFQHADGEEGGWCHNAQRVGWGSGISSAPYVNDVFWCSEHPLRQRDRLAAMAMQGALGNIAVLDRLEQEPSDVFARNVAGLAYEIADAMLKARGEETP